MCTVHWFTGSFCIVERLRATCLVLHARYDQGGWDCLWLEICSTTHQWVLTWSSVVTMPQRGVSWQPFLSGNGRMLSTHWLSSRTPSSSSELSCSVHVATVLSKHHLLSSQSLRNNYNIINGFSLFEFYTPPCVVRQLTDHIERRKVLSLQVPPVDGLQSK